MSVEEFSNIPKISVLIPSYRSGKMLDEALESVLKQSYPALEIVICDDGSENFEEAQLRELAKTEPSAELKILRQKENVGTVRNLNSGLRLCTGEWVFLLAADDVLADKSVVTQLAERAEETDRDWLLGRTVMCNQRLERTGESRPTEKQIGWTKTPQKLYAALCRDCFLPSSGNLYRMEFLRRVGFFDEHFCLVEDWPLFLKAARMGVLPEICKTPAVLHRASGVSRDRAWKNQTYQRDLIETMEREILPNLNFLSVEERSEIKRRCRDKQAIYQLRFETEGALSKLYWVGTHIGVLFRKIIQVGRR